MTVEVAHYGTRCTQRGVCGLPADARAATAGVAGNRTGPGAGHDPAIESGNATEAKLLIAAIQG